MDKDRADWAAASAFSLPMDVYMIGIQQKMIVFPYEVQLEFKPTHGFKAKHRVGKYDEVGVSATTNEIHGKCNCTEFSSENACIVW